MRTNGTAMRRFRTATTDVNLVYKKMRSTASLMRVVDGRGFRYFEACKNSMSVLKFSCKNFSFLFFQRRMCEYFKICVVLLTAFGCSRALCGVEFYCESCKKGVKWEEWGNHAEQIHEGEYREPSILMCPCSSCPCLLTPYKSFTVNGTSVKCADDHMRSEHGDKFVTYDFWCKKCQTVVPRYFWEMHLVQKHGYIDFVQKNGLYWTPCAVCKEKQVLRKKSEPEQSNELGQPRNYNDSSSIMYQSYTIKSKDSDASEKSNSSGIMYQSHTIKSKDSDASEKSNVTFSPEGGDFEWVCPKGCNQFTEELFYCGLCEENEQESSIPRCCFIDHLFAKHNDKVKDYLPQYAFYCKECSGVFETAEKWRRHVYKCRGRLEKEGKMRCFYCPVCKKWPEIFYEDHIVKRHSRRCIYCFQRFNDESKRKGHMKEAHKTFCPFCGKNEFEVPLTVHIARDHEIWEGSCPWDRRYEVYCTLCKGVIKNDDIVGFYSDISEGEMSKKVVEHFVEKHKELKSQFNDYGKEIPETYKFIIQGEHAKIQRVKPCQWVDFPHSGVHVLFGHKCHKRGKILLCSFCQSPVISENNDKWHTKEELLKEHCKLFHPDVDVCQLCKCVYKKGSHLLIREHGDKYWECPVCKEVVSKEDRYHGEVKHSKKMAFCTKCKRVGTGSCPNCGEWVFEQCEKCPQRIYGKCPQCEEAAFGSCPDCYQYVTGKCDDCGEDVNGECLKCLRKVSGKCPVCGESATGWCSKCKQRVVGACPVCGKECDSGACSDCKRKVGVGQEVVYKAFESHMKKKHGEKTSQLREQSIKCLAEAAVPKDDRDFRWCEACGVFVPKNDEKASIAHCRDGHKYSKYGWCALCQWDFDGTREEHLWQNHEDKMKHCNGCGLYVLPGLSKWHSKRHVCRCLKCNKFVPFDHMVDKHGCTSACEPTVDFKNHVWIFNHDKDCDNRDWWECNLEGCKEPGSGDDAFREHIIEYHGCTGKCEIQRKNFQFKVRHHSPDGKHCYGCGCDVIHGLSKWHLGLHVCYCPECDRNVPFDHMVDKHECTSACKPTVDFEKHVWIFNHGENCKNRDRWKCNFEGCKEKGSGDAAFKEHIIKDHGCTGKCEFKRENFQFKVEHNGCDHDEKIRVNCPFDGCRFSGTRAQVLEHVYKPEHGCHKGKCVYRDGRFEHAMNCKWRIRKCWPSLYPYTCFIDDKHPTMNLTGFSGASQKCSFEGTKEALEDHIHKGHGCCVYCKFDNEGFFQHACTCPSRVFICPFCVDDKDKSKTVCVTKEHLKEHGCFSFCHVSQEDDDIDHDPDCPKRGLYKPSETAVTKMKEFVKKLKELELRKAK